MVEARKIKLRKPEIKFTIKIHSLFFFIIFNLYCFSQGFNVTARVDSNNVLIGDHIKLNVELEYPANLKIIWPPIADSLEKIEIIERTSPIIERTQQSIKEKATFTLSVYDTGTYVIPPLNFTYKKIQPSDQPNDTTESTISTNPIPIFVHSVGVDTTKEIKDIKPPLSVPISLSELLPYIIVILAVALVAFLIYYLLKRRKKIETEIISAPKRPAHELALEQLQSLESEKLWQRGEIKKYYSKLSDIIRTYIENRFSTLAMESTTIEILEDLSRIKLNSNSMNLLKDLLTTSDLVKFAKWQPLNNENDLYLTYSYDFVHQTILETQNELEEVKSE
jgi:hypothetical protein